MPVGGRAARPFPCWSWPTALPGGRIERQRLVHAAAGDLLRERIHALSITALALGEPILQR